GGSGGAAAWSSAGLGRGRRLEQVDAALAEYLSLARDEEDRNLLQRDLPPMSDPASAALDAAAAALAASGSGRGSATDTPAMTAGGGGGGGGGGAAGVRNPRESGSIHLLEGNWRE
ncbi:hypothetical protein Agub_g11489, partial [Astrephomene gubernaculifera]